MTSQREIAAGTHLVIGAGPIGSAVALRLANAGRDVRLVTRSGGGPVHESIERLAVDASDPAALSRAAEGATVIYNCANPGSYPQWATVWPPLAASILQAAESSGAVLVTFSNLYGYGPVDGTITRDLPLRPSDHKGAIRAKMWHDALAAHQAGKVRATEARASDYFGPSATAAQGMLAMYAANTLAGKTAMVFADPDQPHTWVAVDDAAATLVALGADERAWGEAWIVPGNPPASVREVLRGLGEKVGAGEPKLRRMPNWVINLLGTFVPLLREVKGVLYQFNEPFVSDGSETTSTFGIEPTPWDELLESTAKAWQKSG